MPHMLAMTAAKISYPVAFFVLMVPHDVLLQG